MELKKTKKNSIKAVSIVALAVIIVAIAGYSTYAFMAKTWPFTGAKAATHSSDESTDVSKSASSSTDSNQQDTNNPDKTPLKYSPPSDDGNTTSPDNPSSSADTINGTLNYANVTNGALEIRATITQFLSSGKCTLTLKNTSTGSVTTYTTNIIANPSSSACDGFNIPVKDLAKGDYDISIKLTSGNKVGTIIGKVSI